MGADGDTEMLLAFVFEGSVGQVRQGKIGSGSICFGEPALGRRGGSIGHGGMIALNHREPETSTRSVLAREARLIARCIRCEAAGDRDWTSGLAAAAVLFCLGSSFCGRTC